VVDVVVVVTGGAVVVVVVQLDMGLVLKVIVAGEPRQLLDTKLSVKVPLQVAANTLQTASQVVSPPIPEIVSLDQKLTVHLPLNQ
jgi:hypothetical protein